MNPVSPVYGASLRSPVSLALGVYTADRIQHLEGLAVPVGLNAKSGGIAYGLRS